MIHSDGLITKRSAAINICFQNHFFLVFRLNSSKHRIYQCSGAARGSDHWTLPDTSASFGSSNRRYWSIDQQLITMILGAWSITTHLVSSLILHIYLKTSFELTFDRPQQFLLEVTSQRYFEQRRLRKKLPVWSAKDIWHNNAQPDLEL